MLNNFNPDVRKNVKDIICEETAYGYSGRLVYHHIEAAVPFQETYYYIIPTKHDSTIQDTDKLTSIISIVSLNKETNLLEPIESDLFKSELTREIQRSF